MIGINNRATSGINKPGRLFFFGHEEDALQPTPPTLQHTEALNGEALAVLQEVADGLHTLGGTDELQRLLDEVKKVHAAMQARVNHVVSAPLQALDFYLQEIERKRSEVAEFLAQVEESGPERIAVLTAQKEEAEDMVAYLQHDNISLSNLVEATLKGDNPARQYWNQYRRDFVATANDINDVVLDMQSAIHARLADPPPPQWFLAVLDRLSVLSTMIAETMERANYYGEEATNTCS
jgi:hypothetical protein